MFKDEMFHFLQWQKYVLAFTSLMLLCLVGSYDYEDKKLEDTHYCKMVAEGAWPAYKEIDGIYCPSE